MTVISPGYEYRTVDVPFVAGKTYAVLLPCGGPAKGYVEVYTRTAKGKTVIVRQVGPGTINIRFIAGKGIIGLVIVPKGGAAWTEGSVDEAGAAVVEPPPPPPPPPETIVAFNISNAEMGSNVPGILGKDYAYPSDSYLEWACGTGVKCLRVCFKWRRLIPSEASMAIKPDDLAHLKRIVAFCNKRGVTVWLDLHDYGRFMGNTIGSPLASIEFFARSWGMIGENFRSDDVIFGLMNEPHGQSGQLMQAGSKAAMKTLRAKGCKQLILVPAMDWSGAHAFIRSSADIMLENPVDDPLNNWAYEVHQYLDSDNSGTHDAVVVGKGLSVLVPFTEWCRAHKAKAVLGEHGVGRDAASLKEMEDMLGYAHANPDVWIATSLWAAGAWWKESYQRAIGPTLPNQQLSVIQKFLT